MAYLIESVDTKVPINKGAEFSALSWWDPFVLLQKQVNLRIQSKKNVLKKEVKNLKILPIVINWFKIFITSLPMGATIWLISFIGNWQKGGNSILNIFVLAFSIIAGIIIYALTSHVFKVQEFRELVSAIKKRGKNI